MTSLSNLELLANSGVVVVRLKEDFSIFTPSSALVRAGVPFDDMNLNIGSIKQVGLDKHMYEYFRPDRHILLTRDLVKITPHSSRSFFREKAKEDPDNKIFVFRTVMADKSETELLLSINEIENKLIVEPENKLIVDPNHGGSRRSKKYPYNSSKTKKSKRMGSTARRAFLLKKRK
jgi:hypothetical protein